MEVAQVFDEVVAPRKALVAHARAILDRAREVWRSDAMDRGLMPLQIGQASEVGRRRAVGELALPGPGRLVSLADVKLWELGLRLPIDARRKPLWVPGSHTVGFLA